MFSIFCKLIVFLYLYVFFILKFWKEKNWFYVDLVKKYFFILSNIKMFFVIFCVSIMVFSIVEKNEVNKVYVNNVCIVI